VDSLFVHEMAEDFHEMEEVVLDVVKEFRVANLQGFL
jgi:hypothetical protein